MTSACEYVVDFPSYFFKVNIEFTSWNIHAFYSSDIILCAKWSLKVCNLLHVYVDLAPWSDPVGGLTCSEWKLLGITFQELNYIFTPFLFLKSSITMIVLGKLGYLHPTTHDPFHKFLFTWTSFGLFSMFVLCKCINLLAYLNFYGFEKDIHSKWY